MASSGYSLKDELFNMETVSDLAQRLKRVYEPFDLQAYKNQVMTGIEALELKERMSHLRVGLEDHIHEDYRTTVRILKDAAEGADPHFVYGAFCEYVEVNGCSREHLAFSLEALGELTKTFSAEFAIRRFINEFPEETLEAMVGWSRSSDGDQRRLASEGLRPKLPWAAGITMDYRKGALPLDNLYYDTERYVTRSVANHLNDLSKIDPVFVLEKLRAWQSEGRQETGEMAYIIGHSTRTLIKRGNEDALALLGYKPGARIEIQDFILTSDSLKIGDSLMFDFDITASEATRLMIDYVIEYPMNGGKRSEKVFKIKKLQLDEGGRVHITKRHPFKLMTTKKLYTGNYKVTLQINGTRYNQGIFHLTV